MKRKRILLLTFISIAITWLLVPWEQLQTNGTADGLSLHKFRGYHPVFEAPKTDESLRISAKGDLFIQPDWLLLSIEDLSILAVGWGAFALSAALRRRSRTLNSDN